MPSSPASAALTNWLRDYNEAPWRRYIDSLRGRGLLVEVDGILVDCEAMFRTRFHCDTRICAGIDREPETESCCTDYEVEITPEEKERIVANADAVLELLSRYDAGRVTAQRSISEFFQESHSISLAKEKGRCVFSYRDPEGRLRCGLHSLALEKNAPIASIKPLTCVFFPIVVYRFENGDTLLTAISRDTSGLMEGAKDTELPCLRIQKGDLMFMECRTAIETGFGPTFFARLTAAAEQFAAAKGPPKGEVE